VFFWIEDYASTKGQGQHSENQSLKQKDGDDGITITLQDVCEKHGVPQRILIDYLTQQIAALESCRGLPFTLLLVISYCLCVIQHDHATYINSVEDSVSSMIRQNAKFAFSSEFMGHKTMDDINSHADIWSWTLVGLVPLVWQQERRVAEGRNFSDPEVIELAQDFPGRSGRGYFLRHNRIVIGMRLRQERSESDGECRWTELDRVYDKACVGGTGYELDPDTSKARTTPNPQGKRWVYIHDDIAQVKEQVLRLEESKWLDDQTMKVEMALPLYNAEYGLHTLIFIDFFFSRGGHVWKEIIAQSTLADHFTHWTNYVYDLSWISCLLWIVATEAIEIHNVIRSSGCIGLKTQYFSIWNMMDWFSMIWSCSILGMYFHYASLVSATNNSLEDLGQLSEEFQREAYRDQGDLYIETLEQCVVWLYYFRINLWVYPFMIVMRLMKAFSDQPRLAVVTTTLKRAAIDLSHFMVIMVLVFFSYAVGGVVLFGRMSRTFTTFTRSVNTCFRMIHGDFDWDDLRTVGRSDAANWMIPFTIIVSMVLTNVLIAIVMDAFSLVQYELRRHLTLWEQGMLVWEIFVNRRELVELETVLNYLETGFRSKKEERDALKLLTKQEQRGRADGTITKEAASLVREKAHLMVNFELMTQQSFRTLYGSIGHVLSEHKLQAALPMKFITTRKLLDIVPEISLLQAETILRDSVKNYYDAHVDEVEASGTNYGLEKINFRTRRLKRLQRAVLYDQDLARNNPGEVQALDLEARSEVSIARGDLANWLEWDHTDQPLPESLWPQPMSIPEDGSFPPVGKNESIPGRLDSGPMRLESGSVRLSSDQSGTPGRGARYSSCSDGGSDSRSTGRMRHEISTASTLKKNSVAEVRTDAEAVVATCIAGGLDPAEEQLWRQAAGRKVQVLQLNDFDGMVLCRVQGIGNLTLPKDVFKTDRYEDSPDGLVRLVSAAASPDQGASVEEMLHVLEDLRIERDLGNETVAEALKAVQELYGTLGRRRVVRREAVERYQELRARVVHLARERRRVKARLKQLEVKSNVVTAERDAQFEKVRQILEENKALEDKLRTIIFIGAEPSKLPSKASDVQSTGSPQSSRSAISRSRPARYKADRTETSRK